MNSSSLKTLNIIGCGRLGRSLARLWADTGTIAIGGICNRTQESSNVAYEFVQAGTVVDRVEQLPVADFWLIATVDSAIGTIAKALASHSRLTAGNIVFHCSGSLSSTVLKPLQDKGAHTASVHPIHSFADPLRTQQSFSGTFCAIESCAMESCASKSHTTEDDENALTELERLFRAIGGNTFRLSNDSSHGLQDNAHQKALYHAATAMASNHLVTVLNSALDMLQQASITRSQARDLLAPIVAQTADNIHHHDCVSALTGPVARGDSATIEHHLAAIQRYTAEHLPLYKLLAQQTLPLAEQLGAATPQQLNQIAEILKK